jgi:sorting nexin-25
MGYIRLFRDGLWPGGRLKSPGTPRTQDEKLQTREQANQKLSALIPGGFYRFAYLA